MKERQGGHERHSQGKPNQKEQSGTRKESNASKLLVSYTQEKQGCYDRPHKEDKEKKKERDRRYRQENKENLKEYRQRHYQRNKEKIQESNRVYKQENKDKLKEQNRRYRQKNKEKIRGYQRRYYQKRKEQRAADLTQGEQQQHEAIQIFPSPKTG